MASLGDWLRIVYVSGELVTVPENFALGQATLSRPPLVLAGFKSFPQFDGVAAFGAFKLLGH